MLPWQIAGKCESWKLWDVLSSIHTSLRTVLLCTSLWSYGGIPVEFRINSFSSLIVTCNCTTSNGKMETGMREGMGEEVCNKIHYVLHPAQDGTGES